MIRPPTYVVNAVREAIRLYQWGRTNPVPVPGQSWAYTAPTLGGGRLFTVQLVGQDLTGSPAAVFEAPGIYWTVPLRADGRFIEEQPA